MCREPLVLLVTLCCLSSTLVLGGSACSAPSSQPKLREIDLLDVSNETPQQTSVRKEKNRSMNELPLAAGISRKPPVRENPRSVVSTHAVRMKPLSLPLRVAVYFIEPDESLWHWTAGERGEMVSWGRVLQRERIVSEVILMSKLAATGTSAAEIREAAKRHGADIALAVRSDAKLTTSVNPMAVFYLTVVGYFIAPGSSAEATMRIDADVLEVRRGNRIFAIEAKGKRYRMLPGGWLDADQVALEAKQNAQTALKKEFILGMRELAQEIRKNEIRQIKARKEKVREEIKSRRKSPTISPMNVRSVPSSQIPEAAKKPAAAEIPAGAAPLIAPASPKGNKKPASDLPRVRVRQYTLPTGENSSATEENTADERPVIKAPTGRQRVPKSEIIYGGE